MNDQNQLMIQGNENLPAYLQDQQYVSVMAGEMVDKTPRISTQGGKFRFIKNGVSSDQLDYIEVVPVRLGPTGANNTYRVLYLSDYDPKKPASPDCWSADGVTPSDNSRARQSASCATCAKNVAGSGRNGARACKFSKTLAVVSPSDWNTVYRLNIPSTTLFDKEMDNKGFFGWKGFIERCGVSKAPPESFVLRLGFTRNSTEGFRMLPIRYLNQDEFTYVSGLSRAQSTIDLVTMDIRASEEEEEAQANTAFEQPPVQQVPVQQAPVQQAPAAVIQPEPVQQTTYAPPPVQQVPVQQAPAAVIQPEPVQQYAPPPVQQAPAAVIQPEPVQQYAPPPVQQAPAAVATPVFEQPAHVSPPPAVEVTDERRARIDALIQDV